MGVSTLVALPEQVGLSHLCRLEIGVFAVPRAHVACGVPSHRWDDVGRRWEKYVRGVMVCGRARAHIEPAEATACEESSAVA